MNDDKLTELPDCPVAITSFGAAVCDDFLYVYGGNQGNAHAYSAEGQNNIFRRVKLKSGSQWESLGEVPRRQGLALVSHNGKVYRVGGFEAKNKEGDDQVIVSTTDFSVFDPETSAWTGLAPLPEPRSSFDAVVSGDTLYVVGGWALQEDGSDSQWHGTAWQMDLSQDKPQWKPLPAPPHERRAHSLAEVDGKIYLIGGMGDDGETYTDTYVFDPNSQKWSGGPELPGQPMDGFGSSAFNVGGRLIVATFGGQVSQLSADGESWEKIKQLSPGRFFHRLVALNDQQFLILGGTSPKSGKQTSVVILDRSGE
jgi:N-acetylneuraminic acid mutarotase